jgi:D-tyrosyl-tRNA(Tyr) deacylase
LIALLQRVSHAAVTVDGEGIADIGRGVLAFVAVHRDDGEQQVARLAERILGYRLFPDAADRMNLSVVEVGGDLLLVPQFTLAADTRKGTRPSFTHAAEPAHASGYFDALADICANRLKTVERGQFGANMQVSLVNDGPVTFWLEASV